MLVFGCHLATKIDALSRLAPRTHFGWFGVPFGTPFFGPPFGSILCVLGSTFDCFGSFGPLWLHFGCLFLSFCTVWPLSWSVLGYIPCFWRRKLPNTAKLILGIKSLVNCYLLFCLATEGRAVYRNVQLESSYRVRGSKFGSVDRIHLAGGFDVTLRRGDEFWENSKTMFCN